MPDRNQPIQGRGHRLGPGLGPGLVFGAVIALIATPTAWWTTDVLEADNDFCNACHLPNGTSLHTRIRDDFDARPVLNLAARHAGISLSARPESPEFRCIDCHGGVGFVGRAKIKLLSAKDGLLYLTGRFEEPRTMSWPLEDVDCSRCHDHFESKGEGFEGAAFHDQNGHNVDLSVRCVECHSVHARDVDTEAWFLRPEPVRTRCAECHVEYKVAE